MDTVKARTHQRCCYYGHSKGPYSPTAIVTMDTVKARTHQHYGLSKGPYSPTLWTQEWLSLNLINFKYSELDSESHR